MQQDDSIRLEPRSVDNLFDFERPFKGAFEGTRASVVTGPNELREAKAQGYLQENHNRPGIGI